MHFLLWIESPELALVVIEAEGSTPGHVSNLDPLRRVQVVSGVLRVLLNRAGWVRNSILSNIHVPMDIINFTVIQ